MKALCAIAAIGLSLMGAMGSVSAQPYGDRDYGRRDRGYGFNEREYLRCNPDVRRAVRRGIVSSGAAHYRVNGRYEHRRLSC
ncbi:hypothetical protein [Methylobacterium nigriterrae]|uniref:hypothetical protein n=1 Tax=Methylobacterium nigriterrae TaxID=3127512 RepID=UPI003013C6D4